MTDHLQRTPFVGRWSPHDLGRWKVRQESVEHLTMAFELVEEKGTFHAVKIGRAAQRSSLGHYPQCPPRSGVANQARPMARRSKRTSMRWVVRHQRQNGDQASFLLNHQ